METQVTGQSKAQASREFSKKLLTLVAAGGAAFWVIDFVISVSPIAAEYKAAFSISSLPVALVEALVGGVVIALCISFFLLRFFDRILGKKTHLQGIDPHPFCHGHDRSLFSARKPSPCLRLPPARHRNECPKVSCPWISYWLFIREAKRKGLKMKAIICPKYGSPDVLQLREVVKPVPQEDEVLIQIHAASLNSRDLRMLWANPFFMRLMPGGLFRPKNKILGADVAGRVEAIGSNVNQFKPGDEVFGYLPSETGRGTFTEFVCAKENLLTLKPANLTFEQAAAVPLAAMTALQGLRDNGNIQPRQKVLINGASGGVGTFAVQIAKAFGAEVTAVCSTRNLEMVRSIGADHVIDYKVEDFTQNGQHYDLILAANGHHPISDYLRALTPDGIYVVAGGSMLQLFQAALHRRRASKTGNQKTYIVSLVQSQKNLTLMKELLESGKVVPVIDGCYPLSKIAEAFWYFEKEHAKGKVVITMEHDNKL